MTHQLMATQGYQEPQNSLQEDTGGLTWHKMSKTMSKDVQIANRTKQTIKQRRLH